MYNTQAKAITMKNDLGFIAIISLYAAGTIYLMGWDNVVKIVVDFIR